MGTSKKGIYSVDEEILATFPCSFTTSVLEYRTMAKDLSTYYKPYIALTWPTDRCIHPKYNHCATATGRLSSSSPNMQNVTNGEE